MLSTPARRECHRIETVISCLHLPITAMDSFAKAFQKGLAKTVAAGQQQLQQRLSKHDQQNTSVNTYGTGPQAQAQYAYGNQGSHQVASYMYKSLLPLSRF